MGRILALGDQAKKDGIALFTYPTNGYFDNTLNALLKETGGEELLSNVLNYDKDAWNTDGAKQTIDILAKLVSPDYLYSDTVSNANAKDGFTMNQQAVIDGKALFMPNGDWVVNEMADTTPEDYHWGLLPLPALEKDGERFVGSMTEQVWIPAQAKNVDDAKAFLKLSILMKVLRSWLKVETLFQLHICQTLLRLWKMDIQKNSSQYMTLLLLH